MPNGRAAARRRGAQNEFSHGANTRSRASASSAPATTASAAATAEIARPRAAAAGSTPSATLGSRRTPQNFSSSSSGLIIRTPTTKRAVAAASCTSANAASTEPDTRTPQMRDAGLCATAGPDLAASGTATSRFAALTSSAATGLSMVSAPPPSPSCNSAARSCPPRPIASRRRRRRAGPFATTREVLASRDGATEGHGGGREGVRETADSGGRERPPLLCSLPTCLCGRRASSSTHPR